MRIHNTFHISLLKPYKDNKFPSQIQEPPSPIQIKGEDKYKLDEIIDSRLHYNKLQYRAKWKGYSPEYNKVWYPAENFNNASLSVRKFHQRYPDKPRLDQSKNTATHEKCTPKGSLGRSAIINDARPTSNKRRRLGIIREEMKRRRGHRWRRRGAKNSMFGGAMRHWQTTAPDSDNSPTS